MKIHYTLACSLILAAALIGNLSCWAPCAGEPLREKGGAGARHATAASSSGVVVEVGIVPIMRATEQERPNAHSSALRGERTFLATDLPLAETEFAFRIRDPMGVDVPLLRNAWGIPMPLDFALNFVANESSGGVKFLAHDNGWYVFGSSGLRGAQEEDWMCLSLHSPTWGAIVESRVGTSNRYFDIKLRMPIAIVATAKVIEPREESSRFGISVFSPGPQRTIELMLLNSNVRGLGPEIRTLGNSEPSDIGLYQPAKWQAMFFVELVDQYGSPYWFRASDMVELDFDELEGPATATVAVRFAQLCCLTVKSASAKIGDRVEVSWSHPSLYPTDYPVYRFRESIAYPFETEGVTVIRGLPPGTYDVSIGKKVRKLGFTLREDRDILIDSWEADSRASR